MAENQAPSGRVIDPGGDRVNPIVRFAVQRRVTMAMLVVGVLVLGWLSLTRLPLEFLPSFSASFVTVNAPYASSSPQETERLIVRPLEDSLGTINGIDTLSATATASSGSVSVGFVDGTDMDLAAVDVRDRVDRVRHLLPDDLERVEIRRFQSSDRPVLRFNVSAPWKADRLYRFVDDVLVRRLQRVEGVADVSVRGARLRQVNVNLLPERLAAHGVDVRDVANVLRANNLSLSAGVVRDGSKVFQVRVEGKITDLEEIRELPLGRGPLRVGDVADVAFDFPEQEDFSFLNGSEAMSVGVYKSSTANLLGVIDGVHDELAAIQSLPDAAGLDVNVYRDDSEDVRNGLVELRNTGLLGGGLAVVFMYLFLRRVRTTLLVAIAIPVSVVVTFVIMFLARQAGWTDMTLNIMSLMGLMLAVGMLVDNSIVVIESIFRHRQELNEDAATATLVGASEVVLPIVASTLTTMCVFLPMVFLPAGGRFSQFMSGIGLTVVIVMAASLVVAITVVPMVAARLLERETPRPHPLFDRMSAAYGSSLKFMLRHRFAFTAAVIVTLVWSWYLYQGIGRSFSPPSFERQIAIEVDVPPSYSVEQKRALYDEVYGLITDHRDALEIADITHSFRRSSGRARGWGGGNRFDIYLVDEEQSHLDTGVIRDRLQALMPVKPGVTLTLSRSRRGHSGSGAGVEKRLVGERVEILETLSDRLVAVLDGVPGLAGADSSLESGTEEIHILPDRVRTLQAGLSSRAVAQTVASALSTRPAAYLGAGDNELDVVVQFRPEDRENLDQINNLPLAFGDNGLTVGAVADLETRPGARAIERENRRAVVTITADTSTGTQSFMAQGMADRALASIDLPAGYSIEESRDWRMGGEDASSATFMLLFAVTLVYMVMASLFESFAQPFTIMFSVPFAFIGVGVIMKITGQPRSSMADMGLIILAGIVVNNAIVLVDRINRLRQRGMERDQAIVLGGRHRLRPILMTAMTTILGLSPMAAPFFLPQIFGAVEGRAAFWAPVGLVILAGLLTSTFLTVTIIPVLYSLVDDLAVFARRVVREVVG